MIHYYINLHHFRPRMEWALPASIAKALRDRQL